MAFPSQEEILKQILERNWKPVLESLYGNKEDIQSDTLLKFAATTFEAEFFKQLTQSDVPMELELLEELYVLHSGKFYELTGSNYKDLVKKLAEGSDGIQCRARGTAPSVAQFT